MLGCVLPERTCLVTVERRNRVACALAVQHFCALQRHRQRVVAEKKERFRGFRIREEVERQAAGFRVPECMTVVRLARQALRANVVAHTAAVVGLRELEGAEANPLLFRCDGFRHAFIFRLNADVGRVPVSIPVRALCCLCVIERDGFALRHRVLPALPEVVPLLTVEQDDGALVDLHGLPRRKQNIRRRGDGFALGGCGGFAGPRQPRAAKLLLIRERRAGLRHQAIQLRVGARLLPEALLATFMHHIKGHAGRDCRAAREIERFERDALVRAFAVDHIEEAEEGQADLLAALRRPEEAAGERAGAEVEFAGEVRKLRLPQIKRFAINGNRRHQPFRRGNHEVCFVNDALIGAAQLLHIIDAIGIRSAKAIDMSALIKAAAHADALIAQREDGFAHARVGGVEALLNDLPRVYLEIYVSGFCHCVSSCRLFLLIRKK